MTSCRNLLSDKVRVTGSTGVSPVAVEVVKPILSLYWSMRIGQGKGRGGYWR